MPSLRPINSARAARCIASSVCPPSATRSCIARPRNIITTSSSLSSSSTQPKRCPLYPRSIATPSRKPTNLSSSTVRTFSQTATRDAVTGTENTIQGTIGEGAKGVETEAQTMAEGLISPDHLNEKEAEIWGMLNQKLKPVQLEVQDISGGCGSMYGIEIVSEAFRGLGMLKQQRLVNEILGDEIKTWHGVQLKTRAP